VRNKWLDLKSTVARTAQTGILVVMVTARSINRNVLSLMKLWLRREEKLMFGTV
jgi:hypothetical protein